MKQVLSLLLLLILFSACNKKVDPNWLNADDVVVAFDGTFKPIMDELEQTFAKKHVEAVMKPVFTTEDSVLRLFLNDSLRLCVATRALTADEKDIVQSHSLKVMQSPIATDALALIVNKNSGDSLITLDEVKGIVSGKITRWEQLKNSSRKGELKMVFDASGSSTVRYMKDSLNNGKDIAGNVYAQGSNEAVIDLVKDDPTIIGVLGANWLKAPTDTAALSSFAHLDYKVMKVSRFTGANEAYYRPYQYYIGTGAYPLVRTIYVITSDPRQRSMVRNFYFFLKGDQGQRIICNHSQMLPYQQVTVRSVEVH